MQPEMNLAQTTLAVNMMLAASKHLAMGGFYSQAVARAYYAVHIACIYQTRAKGLWPQHDNVDDERLSHAQTPQHDARLHQYHQSWSDDLSNTRQSVDMLMNERMRADYHGHTEARRVVYTQLASYAEKLAQALLRI